MALFTHYTSDSCWVVGLVMMCLVTIFGCVAHSVLLWVILSTQSLRRDPSNSFIISLSLTGLLATSIVFPSAIAVYFDYRSEAANWWLTSSNCSTNHVPYPSVLSWGRCSIFQALHNFSLYNSAWLVCVIAFERNISIALPFYTASVIKYVFFNISITGCSILFSLIPILISCDSCLCYSLYSHHFSDPAVSWLLTVVNYFLPILIVLVMYLNIYRIASRARNANRTMPVPYPPENELGNQRVWTVNTAVVNSQTNNLDVANGNCNKAVWTLIVTTGSCITLWSPYFWLPMYYLINDLWSHEELFCDVIPWYVKDCVSTIFTWLIYVSISINPLVYGLLNRAIRSETKRKLTRMWLSRCYMRTDIVNQEGNRIGEPENFLEFLERTNNPTTPA